jgi:hypothetical protein
MTVRIRTGATVQASSRLVFPRICGPSTVRARPPLRNRTMKIASGTITRRKTTIANAAIR